MKKGLFITLEGPDGSGKSTISELLIKYLKEKGVDVELTREPGGTEIGEEIRDLLLSNDSDKMTARTEALLYSASRAQHAEEKIKPLIEEGKVVISDRYVYSSLAYQGYGRELGVEKVMEINEFAMAETTPDLVLFFDISPETALKRKFVNREADRLENEGDTFHNKVYNGYYKSIEKYNNGNVVIIDANTGVMETLSQCKKAVDEYID